MKASEKKEKLELYVFMYQDADGYNYKKLFNSDPKTTEGANVYFTNKINPHTEPGAIVEHKVVNDARVVHNKNSPVGYYTDTEQIIAWREENRQYRATREQIKAIQNINLVAAVKRLKDIYNYLPPTKRAAFLTQVAYLITK